ncbi:hypothetical protein Q7P36_006468 [Cladosporium allicinum]
MPQSPNAARQRASKACVRCNKRKLKCDAVQKKGPCSRCRMDQVDGCVLGTSRRGTYIRQPRHRRNADRGSSNDEDSQQELDTARKWVDEGMDIADGAPPLTDQAAQQQSLMSMFQSYVEQNELDKDGAAAQLGVMLLGEHSPLTFALKESNQNQPTSLHDAAMNLSRRKCSVEQARDRHPSHLSSQDLDYLSARGVFTPPVDGLERLLVSAFLERFYPLYSMVDKDEIWQLHEKSALPYILLHAICMIGATFCDISAIHKYGFESRIQARKSFYDKAKVLFDFEYEKDRVVLLQTVIMLSFWGPHMDSSWNPCSWVGFGVTIAASLGMHKVRSVSQANGKDRGLIKRIWWTLLVRDAYCAALMGRPARVDMSQCDTEMLTPGDFPDNAGTDGNHPIHVLYQISAARLSLIVRQIIAKCPMAESHTIRPADLYGMLSKWREQLPSAIAFDPDTTKHSNIFSTSLKLLYHHHVLSIHLKWPQGTSPQHDPYLTGSEIPSADASAHVISSMASTLVTKRIISQFPTEVYTGFFMAGIVFYRQLRQGNRLTSDMARASLNNCQLLLHEVREIFDPTRWVIRIFEFLLSNAAGDDENTDTVAPPGDKVQAVAAGTASLEPSTNFGTTDETFNLPDDMSELFSMNWDHWNQGPESDVLGIYNGTWLMPDVLSTL